jgi:hypothetical protein
VTLGRLSLQCFSGFVHHPADIASASGSLGVFWGAQAAPLFLFLHNPFQDQGRTDMLPDICGDIRGRVLKTVAHHFAHSHPPYFQGRLNLWIILFLNNIRDFVYSESTSWRGA